ncbi:hypothetical protein ACLM5H_21525 [Fredinandcohnia humi]
MKKTTLFLFLFMFITVSSAQALSWAYSFVVWKGNVYQVTDERVMDVGKVIGEVKRGANDMTGKYFGDASNAYPKGTKYYEITGVPTKKAIAVEVEDKVWQKAIYQHEAPTHWLEYVLWVLLLFLILGITLFAITRLKRGKA